MKQKLALSLAAMLLPLSAAAAIEPAEEPRALGVEASIVFPSDSSIPNWRSEEHTSELQSLMRISYAVFCLKKKNETNTLNTPATKHNQPHQLHIEQNNNIGSEEPQHN